MSRSWTDWRRRLQATPPGVVGLGIGRTALTMLEGRNDDGKRQIIDVRRQELSVPLFSGTVRDEHRQALVDALRRMCADLGKRHVPVHVALPNPTSNIAVFELEQLPAGRKAQAGIGRWLITKERLAGKGDAVCTVQPLGQNADKHLLLVQAMDAQWHRCLIGALREVGLVAWSMNPAAIYAYNRFHERITAESNDGAAVMVDADSWTVMLWDAAARVRVLRSRWREASAGDREQEMHALTAEAERMILAYIHGDAGRQVRTLYVSAMPEEATALVSALNGRLVNPCVSLPACDVEFGAGVKPEQFGSFALALAAVHA